MTRPELALSIGEGERAERRTRRRMLTVKGALFVIGLFSGGYVGYALAADDFDLGARWPTGAAVALALIYLVALGAGSWLLHGKIDELERRNAHQAAGFAGVCYIIAYPVWFLLWKGGLLIEPIHWLIFIGFWVMLFAATLYYRLR